MIPPGEPTSIDLLHRVRQNDSVAWDRLMLIYRPLVSRWVARTFDERQPEHEDIVQDVFVSVLRSIGTFRRDRPTDSFRGWLQTIAANKIVDGLRRRSQQPRAIGGESFREPCEPDVESVDLSGDEKAEAELIHRRVAALIRTDFEEKTWRAFWEVTVEERAVGQVAEELGLSEQAVRTYKSRVLMRLRAEFADLEPGP